MESSRIYKQGFDELRSIKWINFGRIKPDSNEKNEFTIDLKVIEDPHTSCKKVANETNFSKSIVLQIVHKNKLYLYHIKVYRIILWCLSFFTLCCLGMNQHVTKINTSIDIIFFNILLKIPTLYIQSK